MKVPTKQELKDYIALLESDIEALKKQNRQLEQEKDHEIEDLNMQLLNAKGKIMSSEITLASYKDKIGGRPVIVEGPEKDLYSGEQKDFILSLVKEAQSRYQHYTRPYAICQSILDSNEEVGQRRKMQECLLSCLKGYSGMDKATISRLKEVGIEVALQGKGGHHYKLIFCGDNRYSITIANTPSDVRSGMNTISDIKQLMF